MNDLAYMRLALEQAKKCVATPTAFCVGAVIVLPKGAPGNTSGEDRIISTGYSRELPGNTHAEQCALDKISNSSFNTSPTLAPNSAVIYTTMEPCSERLSGNLPCVDRILNSNLFHTVKVGIIEPDTFVVKNVGKAKLEQQGVGYSQVYGLEKECLEVARQGH
ncbi:cytidine deaminase-like protein [Lipomyces japonicus]|uniref:cytidine deaminase-like protein n=1 Tax=Lipomyces japonicus TaxID=56871 RepID=UPI0034CEA039